MEDYKSFISTTFDAYKRKNKYDVLKLLPIYDDSDSVIAYLRPITFDFRDSIKDCAHLLSVWLEENRQYEKNFFEISDERTARWLDNLVLARDDRLLFMIQLLDGSYIGHLGYSEFIFETKTAQIIAVTRGVKDVSPGIMTFAMDTMLWWGREVLGLDRIQLRVDSANERAIRLYERVGFTVKSKIALVKIVEPDEIIWTDAPDPDAKDAERYDLLMQSADC
jgi:RimJ/RimL family protein N-acetyltransferase